MSMVCSRNKWLGVTEMLATEGGVMTSRDVEVNSTQL